MTIPFVQLPPQLNMVTVLCEPIDNHQNTLCNTWDSGGSVQAGHILSHHDQFVDQQTLASNTQSNHPYSIYENSYEDQRHWPNQNHAYYDTRTPKETPSLFAPVSHLLAAPFSLLNNIKSNTSHSSKRRGCCCCFCCC